MLPLIILIREEDGLVTALLANGLDSLELLRLSRAGLAVAVTLGGPAALQIDGLVTRANLAQDLELVSNEITGRLGADIGIEVRVDVGTGDANDIANGSLDIRSLPDVQSLSNGIWTLVTATLALDGKNKLTKLGRRAEAVHDSLITSNEKLDHVPLGPLGQTVNLLLDVRVAVSALATSLDENTNNHLEAVLLASRGDGLESVAVSGVNTDNIETALLELSNILVNLTSRLALSVCGLIGGVGDTPVIIVSSELAVRLSGRLRRSRLGGVHSRLRSRRSRLRGSRLGCLRSRGGARETRAGEGAVSDIAGLGDGDDLLGSSIGTGVVGGGDGIDNDGLLSHRGGDGLNDIRAGRGADEGGRGQCAGGDAAAGDDGRNRASDGGGRLDDGRNTTECVSSRRHLG